MCMKFEEEEEGPGVGEEELGPHIGQILKFGLYGGQARLSAHRHTHAELASNISLGVRGAA